jgi:glycerophosphoryl diester phosphodiesterase
MNPFSMFLSLLFFVASCNRPQPKSSPTPYWEVIAHRGASGYLPEHTLEAVAMAAAWGVDFIEPDVVLSRDSIPVVLHDIHLESNTDVVQKFPTRKRKDGRYYVRDFTLKELKTLNVRERTKEGSPTEAVFPKRFPRSLNTSSFRIPTLEEYLELIEGLRQTTGHKLGVYPEIKNPEFHEAEGQDITQIVYSMLLKFAYDTMPEKIYIQSFDPRTLKRLKNEFKTPIPLIQLIGKNSWQESSADYESMLTEKGLREIAAYAVGIGPGIDQILNIDPTTKRVEANEIPALARKQGLKIHSYTHRRDQLPSTFISNTELLSILKNDAKVDGIFSDFADEILKWEGRL